MGKKIKDLKLKKVGSKAATENDSLYVRDNSYLTEKDAVKINKKRNKRRFFTGFACVSLLVIFVSAMVTGSFVAWDMYGKEPTGLTLPQAVSTVAEMYKDGSGVVTNPYDPEADLESFYTDLKKGLYLSQECEISVEDIVSGLLSSMTNGENGESGENADTTLSNGGKLIMSDESAPEIGANGSITGNPALDDLLESLEFDFSVLEGKDQETLEKEMLELTDKELAAVLNEAFSSIGDIDPLKQIETEYGVKVADFISVQQVIIDEATVLEQKDVRVQVTLKLNIRDAAKTALQNNKEKLLANLFQGKEVPGIVSSLADMIPSILPKTLYITASVFPNQQTWSSQVLINNMEGYQQDAVNKLLNRFMLTSDSDGNKEPLLEGINRKVYDTIAKVNELIPINFTPTGSVDTKPIQAVINMLGAENLTQGDFLALIRDVKLPTAESIGVDGYTEEAQILAANNFINGEFSEKYYFNNKIEGSDEYYITANNLFTKLNSFSEEEETLQKIEIRDKIQEGLDYGDGGDFRPFADEKTLAALLNGYLKNQAYTIENMEPWIMDVSCTETGTDDVKGDYFTLRITIELDLTGTIDAQLKDNESMKKLVKQLLPESIYVFLTYTQYEGTDTDPSVAHVDINKKGNEMSRQHFETLMSLLAAVQKKNPSQGEGGDDPAGQVSGMTFDELEAQLNEKIYQAFTDIEKNMGTGIEFVSSSGSAQGGAILPNIFEILANNEKLSYDPEQDASMTEDEFNAKYKMSGEEMYLILSKTYKYDATGTDVESNIDETTSATGVDNFVNEISNKYYINIGEDEDWSVGNIQNMLKTVSGDYQNRLRMSAENGKSGLLDDTASYEELYPYLSQFEFANIVNESGKLDNLMQILPTSKVEYILIYLDGQGNPNIRMRINGDISFENVTGEDAETIAQNKKYSTLFPYDVDIIVDIAVMIDETTGQITGYEPSVNVNSIADDQLDKMLFFVKRFSGQTSTGDGQELSKEGLELTIKNKLSGAFDDMTADGKVDIDFVEKSEEEGGIQLSTVFELAVNNIYTEVGEEKPSGEAMRSTIKGLHEGLGDYAYSNSAYNAENVGDDNGENSAFFIEGGIDQGVASATVTAQFMDAYMVKKMSGDSFTDIVGGNEGDIEFYQSYILPAYVNGNDEEMQRNNAVRSYFGLPVVDKANAGGADADPNTNSYMLITLKVSTANLINTENKGNKLVPQEIFITAQIRLESGNSEKDTRIFVNTLSDEECEIMNRILKSAGYDKTLFGDENVNPGEETSTQKLISNIFDSELVNYTYTIDLPGMGQYTHTFVITVRDVISESYVWYCSLYDGDTDDRRPYILSEAAKSFNNVGDPRYGIAYLRFEKSESLDLLN